MRLSRLKYMPWFPFPTKWSIRDEVFLSPLKQLKCKTKQTKQRFSRHRTAGSKGQGPPRDGDQWWAPPAWASSLPQGSIQALEPKQPGQLCELKTHREETWRDRSLQGGGSLRCTVEGCKGSGTFTRSREQFLCPEESRVAHAVLGTVLRVLPWWQPHNLRQTLLRVSV